MKEAKVILIHGNGGGKPSDNWFPYLESELSKAGVAVVAREFPDNDLARESFWIPFLKDELRAGENTVLVGHSSGAIAAMRFAENHKILGSVLVGAYYTDLGYKKEKLSGYFNRPWNRDAIKRNQQWIVQFASTDDRWIPIEEPRFIHEKLKGEYYEYEDKGHFGGDYHKETFPEALAILKNKLLETCR
jgi:predicted alpha/beta hydrolase family esterase